MGSTEKWMTSISNICCCKWESNCKTSNKGKRNELKERRRQTVIGQSQWDPQKEKSQRFEEQKTISKGMYGCGRSKHGLHRLNGMEKYCEWYNAN